MARFRKNPTFDKVMAQEAIRSGVVRVVAGVVAQHVRNAAPQVTGKYAASIKTSEETVYTDDPFGHLVEWGSANNPPYAPLRRGVQAAGLRLDEGAVSTASAGPTYGPLTAVDSLLQSRGVTSSTHYVDTVGRVRRRGA